MRVNLSVAIVAMVNSSANSNINSSSSNRKRDRISMLISFRGFFTLGTTNVRNIWRHSLLEPAVRLWRKVSAKRLQKNIGAFNDLVSVGFWMFGKVCFQGGILMFSRSERIRIRVDKMLRLVRIPATQLHACCYVQKGSGSELAQCSCRIPNTLLHACCYVHKGSGSELAKCSDWSGSPQLCCMHVVTFRKDPDQSWKISPDRYGSLQLWCMWQMCLRLERIRIRAGAMLMTDPDPRSSAAWLMFGKYFTLCSTADHGHFPDTQGYTGTRRSLRKYLEGGSCRNPLNKYNIKILWGSTYKSFEEVYRNPLRKYLEIHWGSI